MDIKTLFGLTVLPASICGGILLACLSQRIRDAFFVLLVLSSPLIERLDVNFASHEWYRGTSRGFEVSVPDVLAISLFVSAILAPRRGESRGYWPASLGLMLLFFFYCMFNVATADPKIFGEFELLRMARGFILVLGVAFYLRSERELKLLIFSVALLVCYQAGMAFKERYLWGIHRVYGTLDESNSLSAMLCTTSPFLVAAINARIPKRLKVLCALALPLACVAEVMTISRAGVIIIGLVLLGTTLTTMSWRITARRCVIALVIVAGATGLVAKSWKNLQARFQEDSFKEEYGNNRKLGRGYYLRVARYIAQDQLFGVGLNNWSYWVSNRYGPRLGYRFVPYKGTDHEPRDVIPSDSNVDEAQAAPAHSLGALTLGELGIPGLVLFSLVWLRWFQMGLSFLRRRSPEPTLRMGVGIFFGFLGMFLQCLTEWVFRHLPLYYVFHILLGALMSLYFMKRRAAKTALDPVQEPTPEGLVWAPIQ